MKICIIGAGAMGSLLGWYLSQEAEVWLLDSWHAHIDIINAAGLCCERDGVEDTRHLRATTDPAMSGTCDLILVLVKSHQTPWAAEQARLLLAEHSVVVTLQNGVGNRELLSAVLGEERVGQGVTGLGATLIGPGRVRHAGWGTTVFSSIPDRQRMVALAALFAACKLPAELSDDLDSLVWGKLIVNVGINALTALLRVPNGALVAVPEARSLMELAVQEAITVATARGTQLREADPIAHVLAVAQATAANRSSMLQDALRGSPTEIATINGAVVREGQRLGIATPVNAMLTALVGALDATAGWRVPAPH